MKNNLKQLVIDEFSGEKAQPRYIKKAKAGLWLSEKRFLNKYFTKTGRVLDLGCGTGRTAMPLMEMGFEVVNDQFSNVTCLGLTLEPI